jgi:hypothetical protein
MNNEIQIPETLIKAGFVYRWQHLREGRIIDEWDDHNIMPTVGQNYMLGAAFAAVSPVTTWYLGLFTSSVYVPALGDTMSTIIASATEFASYSGSVRLTFTPDAIAGGVLQNASAPGAFTVAGLGVGVTATIYGAFMTSSSVRGGSTGTLASSVKFTTAKTVVDTDILRVIAGMTLTST